MPEVLDISSDEEEGLEKSLSIPDFNWIRDFLLTSDEESNDSDEVVVIHETNPEVKSKSSTLAAKDGNGDDDDDDCVVLEGDPENGVASAVEEANGSDELLVIGEKGQIACRDYPHARHLCAKFPFSSTPHEKHCSQCHCYVCDSLAPCLKWGTGILSSDHCHANDKTELWKIQRKNFKLGQSSLLPASTNFGTSLRPGRPQSNEFLHLGVSHLSPNSVLPNQASRSTAMYTIPSLNSIPQIQASRPTITRSLSTSSPNSSLQNQVSRPINTPIMSTATNITIPDVANYGKCRESRSTLVRNRYHPHSVPRPALGVRSHTIQRERGNGASGLSPQVLHPHMMSKGLGSAGNTLMANNSSHGSPGFSNRVNMTQQHNNYHPGTRFSNYRNSNRPYNACRPPNISFYSQPSSEPASLTCVNQHAVASGMHAYGQPLPQSNNSQGFYQTCIQVNDAPSSYAARMNSSQHGNEPQIRSQNENASGNTTQCGTASQDTSQPQPQPHEESPRETAGKLSAFESRWTDKTGQSILQSSGSVGQPPNVKESGAQFIGSDEPQFIGSNETLIDCSQLPSSLVDFDNWLLDKDTFPVVPDEVLPSDLSIPSPDFDPVDMGMALFYHDGE